jgi:hypothetical protein
VNGSTWVARQAGIRRPDLTVIAGHSTRRDTPKHVSTRDAWREQSTRELLFLEIGATADGGKAILESVGFTYGVFRSLNAIERSAIILQVCGVDLGSGPRDTRISNGLFAATVAIWAGAKHVVLAGFSLQGGHAYMVNPTPRHHLKGDDAFLTLAPSLSCSVSTTSGELHERFGIKLV